MLDTDASVASAANANRLFAGADQPDHRSFALTGIAVDGGLVPVMLREEVVTPFVKLVEFSRADALARPPVLVVTPVSGHFAILFRDLVAGLLADFRVHVTDWTNVRHVPPQDGRFNLDINIQTVCDLMRQLDQGLTVIGLCQGGPVAIAATALLSAVRDPAVPRGLALVAAPIDPLANPTRVVSLLRSSSTPRLQGSLICGVSDAYRGNGRLVYPAEAQLASLSLYLSRRLAEGGELWRKIWADDGLDPVGFPFLDLFTSIMDIDAEHFTSNTESLYRQCALARGSLSVAGRSVDLGAIDNTSVFTIEGAKDDIVAPGQTSAAHQLCRSLKPAHRGQMIVKDSGHFSLFHGTNFREHVLPELADFLSSCVA